MSLKAKISFMSNLYFRVDAEPYTLELIREFLTLPVPGSKHSPLVKNGQWDGNKSYMTAARRLVPVGLLHNLYKFCTSKNITLEFLNKYESIQPEMIEVNTDHLSNIELRDYQIECVNRILKHPFGIIKAATGAGKTEIICSLVKCFGNAKGILILVNGISIAQQTRDRLLARGIDSVGICIGEEKLVENKRVVISTIQSMIVTNFVEVPCGGGKVKRKKVGSSVRYPHLLESEMVIVDECKNSSSASFNDILAKCKATRRYGFDATPYDINSIYEEFEIKKFLGPILYDLSASTLIDEKGILCKPKIYFVKVKSEEPNDDIEYHDAYEYFICKNQTRHEIIKSLVNKGGNRILILVKKIGHGEELEKIIPNSIFISGRDDSDLRREWISKFNSLSDDKVILIGSTIFDEAIDFSNGADTLIIAGAGKSFKKTIQRLGRVLRMNKKGYVNVYDFFDHDNKYLRNHSRLRKKHYKSEGHEIYDI